MAAPITHIVLAQKALDTALVNAQRGPFLVGTSLPDIRYLGVISRAKTHVSYPSLDEIRQSDAFRAGVLFHTYVDEERESFMERQGVYDTVPRTETAIQALKFYEDQLLYERIQDWATIVTFFEDVEVGELDYEIKRGDIEKWHELLTQYFADGPNATSRGALFREIGVGEDLVAEIEGRIRDMGEDEQLPSTIQALYDQF